MPQNPVLHFEAPQFLGSFWRSGFTMSFRVASACRDGLGFGDPNEANMGSSLN